MSLLESMTAVRALLQPLAPAYLRDTLKEDDAPNDPQHFILDFITLSPGYGLCLTPRYDAVVLQVGAWAKGAEAAYTLAQAARDALEPERWQVQSGVSQREGAYRGMALTFRKLY